MNNKGYTLIETIIVLALAGILVYSMIYMPTDILNKHTEYTVESRKLNELALLRTAIVEDLNNGYLEKINNETLIIGKSKYTFNSNTIRENNEIPVILTNSPLKFELENNILIITYNKQEILKYTVNSSFNKGGDNIG